MAEEEESEHNPLIVAEDEEGGAAAEEPKGPTFMERIDSMMPTWDRVFAYDTPKTLRMLDRRLGFINLAGRSVVWIYIVIYVLLVEGRMFHSAPGYGPVMVKVVNDTYVYAKTPATAGSVHSFTAFDSVDVVNPFLESGALFVMTSLETEIGQQAVSTGTSRRLLGEVEDVAGDSTITTTKDGKTKGAKGVNWQPQFGTNPRKFELDDVGDMKIRVFATVSFPSIDPTGSETFETSGGFVGKEGIEADKNSFTISDVLESAGTSVDEVKKDGAIVQVNLLWNCFLLLPVIFGKCEPTLKAVRLDTEMGQSGFSLWRTRHYYRGDDPVRDLEKMTGIRMLWRSVGTGGQLDVVGIIFHIAAGIALLPIAAVVTEVFMWHILPERKHYARNLYSETPDFYQLDDIQADREERERRKKEEESSVDVEALFADDNDQGGADDEHGNM